MIQPPDSRNQTMTSRPARKPRTAKKKTSARSKAARVMRLPHGTGREALLAAAVRAVAREGPDGLSYRAVAREAGVTHGLVHYHFGSREKLVAEAYKWAVTRVIDMTRVYPSERWIEDYADALADLDAEEAELHIFLNTIVLDACRESGRHKRKLVIPVFNTVFEAVENAVRAMGVPTTPALARLIMGALIGVTLQRQVLDSPEKTRECLAELRRLLECTRKSG